MPADIATDLRVAPTRACLEFVVPYVLWTSTTRRREPAWAASTGMQPRASDVSAAGSTLPPMRTSTAENEDSRSSTLRCRKFDLSPVLTSADVGCLLGLQSERAARNLIARQGIPRVRVGRRTLVLRSSLLRRLRERESIDDRGARMKAILDQMGCRRRRGLDGNRTS